MRKCILFISASLLVLSGCTTSYKDIRLSSFDIVSMTPRGLSKVDATVDAGIYNPLIGFEVSELVGALKMDGDTCVIVTSPSFFVEGRSDQVYRLPVHGKLAPAFNPLRALTLVKDLDLSVFTVDVSAKVSLKHGPGKKVEWKDMELKNLLKDKK